MCVFFALMRTVSLPGNYVRLWVPLISAAISAVAAGIVALLAIFRRAERSILMLLPLLVAALVLLFTIGGMNEGTNPCKEVKGITHGN
jgi:uncharacterized RDD family membrane protein YckC